VEESDGKAALAGAHQLASFLGRRAAAVEEVVAAAQATHPTIVEGLMARELLPPEAIRQLAPHYHFQRPDPNQRAGKVKQKSGSTPFPSADRYPQDHGGGGGGGNTGVSSIDDAGPLDPLSGDSSARHAERGHRVSPASRDQRLQ
jgi:hypothetical protein